MGSNQQEIVKGRATLRGHCSPRGGDGITYTGGSLNHGRGPSGQKSGLDQEWLNITTKGQ